MTTKKDQDTKVNNFLKEGIEVPGIEETQEEQVTTEEEQGEEAVLLPEKLPVYANCVKRAITSWVIALNIKRQRQKETGYWH